MNYLSLCDTLIKEAGLEESGVLSVTGQKDIKKKVVDWVARAWLEIQNKRDWNFLWAEGEFSTVVGENTYSPATNVVLSPDVRRWNPYSFTFTTVNGTKFYMKYVRWNNVDRTTLGNDGPVREFSIKPNNALVFLTTPTEVGVVKFEYIRTPQILAANLDEPLLPEAYHDIILYQAMIYLAAEQDATELYQDAYGNLQSRLTNLAAEALPNISIAATPLA